MSDVVTGEAVVVEVRVAQLPSRVAALLIDLVVQGLTLLGASFLVGLLAFSADGALLAMIYIALTVLVIVGYPVIFETLSRGRSLGKLALGLRVVGDDGGPERFRQALFRGLAGVLEFWMLSGAPALISSLISEKGKRLGDVFAGTMVISERGPRQYGPLLEMPAPLAAWAATLELSRLPEDIAATARQYLMRWHDLSPAVQHEMGVRIATEMAAFVSPPSPPGVPPFAYLTAVLAERRRRDHLRLAHQAGARPQHYPAQPFPGQPHQQASYPAPLHQQTSYPGQPHQQTSYPGQPSPAPSPQQASHPGQVDPMSPPSPHLHPGQARPASGAVPAPITPTESTSPPRPAPTAGGFVPPA
ncbi:RDD family protein [Streptosporangium sp. NBC_01639]|uniref:RDD family protein n=1 Tax=Streptosporangium sp. NBC_01639 TaxID=2975948 RepID=UPI0038638E85|nr:RDD family protein [Streptosporangium sp. NBC_01639]